MPSPAILPSRRAYIEPALALTPVHKLSVAYAPGIIRQAYPSLTPSLSPFPVVRANIECVAESSLRNALSRGSISTPVRILLAGHKCARELPGQRPSFSVMSSPRGAGPSESPIVGATPDASTTGSLPSPVQSKDAGSVPRVTLDPDAIQKFAEIEVRWDGRKSEEEPTVLIRGLERAEYHKDAAAPTMRLLREAGAAAVITGGGRISHSTKKKSIFVYGYSMQFGPANLPRVAEVCREAYPGYEVTWKEGGY